VSCARFESASASLALATDGHQHFDGALSASYNPRMRIVAVIGASSNRRKFGNKALRAFAHQGFTVIPINPHETAVEGHRAYASVLDVPGPIDMATVYVHADAGIRVMDEVAKKGIPEVWLNPGADDPEVVARAQALGLKPILACSMIAIGESPGEY
jgi:predicted CoA-binding protein